MALFSKNRQQEADVEETFSEYVDSLLDDEEPSSAHEQALRPDYSIDQAVALMRKMPKDNQDLIVAVVRDTLQSANIDVEAIIHDAEHKSAGLQQCVSDLKDKIAALGDEIKDMESQIKQAEQDLAETSLVRKLLQESVAKRSKAEAEVLPTPISPQKEKSTATVALESNARDSAKDSAKDSAIVQNGKPLTDKLAS